MKHSWKMTGLAMLALSLASGSALAQSADGATVAFLMPDQASTRYEEHDYPGFKAEMAKLCASCKVLYQNADADAARQQQQFNSMISQGAKVIVIDPVDSTAAASLVKQAQAQGVKVIAYDRPIPDAKADFYVSFDNEAIGKSIADSLVKHLKDKGVKAGEGTGVLQINGSPTDAAAGLIKKGIHAGLDNSGYPILAEYDTPEWAPPKAQQWASGQITRFDKNILGVVAANDGTAGGAIAAFKAGGYKPSEIVAAAAANIAVQLVKGETPKAETTLFNTPSQLFVPVVVTQENLKAEIIDKKIATAEQLCVDRYAEGCKKLGITQ